MTIAELEADLASAQARLERAFTALVPADRDGEEQPDATVDAGGEAEAYEAAYQACLAAERALALAKGEETALSCPWDVPWDTGAPLPHVVASGHKAYLLYLVSEPDPDWDGSYVTVVDPAIPEALPIALVAFTGYYDLRFGGPNDEVFEGHPLYGKGLEAYGAHLIANSRWLAELEQINAVHSNYSPAVWKDRRHYLLLFHDEMFECIAEGHAIEVFRKSFADVLAIATARLFDRD